MALPTAPAFTVLIPARYASTRLPGKPLADIAGKPMVVRVAERARAAGAARVVVATDDERVRAAVAAHGIAVCMTRADHPTGTDRLAEAAAQLGLADDAIVVNVQGDEPLLEPALIRAMARRCWRRTRRRDRHRLPSDRRRRRSVQPERRQGRARRARLRAVLQPRDDSVGARRVRRSARRASRRPAALPALRALRVPRRFPARLPRRSRRRRSSASRRWSSCARSGTATGSWWRSPRERRRPASTRPRISSASARSTPGAGVNPLPAPPRRNRRCLRHAPATALRADSRHDPERGTA